MGVDMVVVSGRIGANNNRGGIESDCWGNSGKWLTDITDVSTIILLLIRLRLQEICNMLVNKVAKGTVMCNVVC